MRSLRFALCLAVILLLPFLNAHTQTAPGNATVKIPFDFMIGSRMFLAGEYAVRPVSHKAFVVQARHGLAYAVVPAAPSSSPSQRSANLIFDHSGRSYLLLEICSGRRITQELARYHSPRLIVASAQSGRAFSVRQ